MIVNNKVINEHVVKNFIAKTLYYAYKNDTNFPESCGTVSSIMTFLLSYTDISKYYYVNYIRGYYKNPKYEDENFCEDYVEINRSTCEKVKCCYNKCTCCDVLTGHSWIEITDKDMGELTILDFTSIQFKDDYSRYKEELLISNHTEDSLLEYIAQRSNFVINKKDKEFENYIPIEVPREMDLIVRATNRLYKKNIDNEIIEMLKYSNLI